MRWEEHFDNEWCLLEPYRACITQKGSWYLGKLGKKERVGKGIFQYKWLFEAKARRKSVLKDILEMCMKRNIG